MQGTNGSLLPKAITNNMDSSMAVVELEPQDVFYALCCPHPPCKTPPLLIKPSKSLFVGHLLIFFIFFFSHHRKDEKEYALKQIEGTGISMSACREIAVSYRFHY